MDFVPPPDPPLAALFNAVKGIPPLPDVMRARAIIRARARARAIVQARVGWADDEPIAVGPVEPRPRRWHAYVSLTAAVLLGTGIGGVAVALELARMRPQPASAPFSDLRLAASRPAARAEVLVPQPTAPTPSRAVPRLRQPTRTVAARESYAEEIELLERAQAALSRRDFGAALALLAEHARRFPHGRLAEEREALKVRLLAGSGHAADARRAEVAFADQFPRSPLLPRLQEEPTAK